VVGRSQERRDRFIEKMGPRLGIPPETSEAEAAVREANVLITATGSSEPVFDGAWLSPGTHANAVGSNLAEKREIDCETLSRSSRVVADSVDVAQLESGDLLRNGFDFKGLEELGALVAGSAPGRRRADESTLFEPQVLALEDLVCAVRVPRRAHELGVGTNLPV
jgi:ornithine cyclodeaminase/alanine dehydrogenase-like protein (mu-crystallin family)